MDDTNAFKGMFFCTREMRQALKAWPHVVFLDGTYKLLILNLVLMLLVVEDSSGQSLVVGAALFVHEDKDTFAWFLNTFKEVNKDACEKIQSFMCDKDHLQREVLKSTFPNVPVYICRFHIMQIFNREIGKKTKGLTKDAKEEILRTLQDLVYSSSEADYDRNYNKLLSISPPEVVDYYIPN